jgi:hypothetical protein
MSSLSRRTLNRTLLSRQLLLRRAETSTLAIVERLVAMQAQEPNWPYVGLWARRADFRHDDLSALLRDRVVVRSTALRSTMHLVGAADFAWLRPMVQPAADRVARTPYFAKETAGLDLADLARTGAELLGELTLPRRELARLLAERFPDRHGGRLAGAVELQVPLVHSPDTGAWGSWASRRAIEVTRAEAWTGRPMVGAPALDVLIDRYLAAFGPASVRDLQAWSGLTKLRGPVEERRSRLHAYRAEDGTELFDLPDAALADEGAPAPVRFLPGFDNVVLGHADRSRIVADEDRGRLAPGYAMVPPSFLVDGFAAGTWELRGLALVVTPFRRLVDADAAAVADEARRLLAFVLPDESAGSVEFR